MHEFTLIANLLKILENIKKNQESRVSFLAINITINPYSCIDEENLNFIFKSMAEKKSDYRNARICVTRGNNPAEREFILDSVEMEITDEAGQNDTGGSKHI
jgi:Zn finger protein HypA/HybF involved in hydrogenase expression